MNDPGVDSPARVAALRTALEAVADPDRAEPMAAYMKDRFVFLGIAATPRRAAARPFSYSVAMRPSV